MNPENLKYLKIYETIKRNAGCTPKSIDAIIWTDLKLFAEWLRDKPLQEVITLDIEKFFTYCRTERKNEPETVSRKQSSLNTFYETMIKREYFNIKNPLNKIEKIKFNSKPRSYLSKSELKQLLQYLKDKKDLRGIAYVLLTYSSGCRVSEIVRLNRNDLDYNRYQFKVLGKGLRYRNCIFSKEAGKAIKQYLATRSDDNPAMFLSRERNRWSKESIERF